MSDAPVQLIVAAFNDPNKAGQLLDELKAGKKEGLVGIIDAAVVVKDANGNLKIQDAKKRSTKGLLTGGVVGGALGLLLGPVGWAAVAGGAIGALAGKLSGAPLKAEMKDIGASLTPNSSAIVAVIEHTWVVKLEEALAAEGAYLVREALKADIAAQLEADGNVVYTAVDNTIARLATSPEGTNISGLYLGDDQTLLVDAHFATPAENQDIIEGTATPITEEASE